MTPTEPRDDLRASWETNADAWTAAVREGRIASRRLVTDAAVRAACDRALGGRVSGARVLDAGCGEGWLARALAANGAEVLGVDASAALVERARAASANAAAPRYATVSYEALRADDSAAAGPFDLVVCNFALLDADVPATLAALARRLAPEGALVLQTVHPWAAAGDGPYRDGWREETFAAFDTPFPATMPWYFRTLASWLDAVSSAGLALERCEEPLHPETARPASLLLTIRKAQCVIRNA